MRIRESPRVCKQLSLFFIFKRQFLLHIVLTVLGFGDFMEFEQNLGTGASPSAEMNDFFALRLIKMVASEDTEARKCRNCYEDFQRPLRCERLI